MSGISEGEPAADIAKQEARMLSGLLSGAGSGVKNQPDTHREFLAEQE